jgi:DNA invertase Pin-like site-specific DNA recombinase
MSKYIYNRVSTEKQDYAQQMQCINEYFHRMGIDPACVSEIVTEKVSGTKDHTERKLNDLMKKCVKGDIIYFSELSRLGRNMVDLNNIVNDLCKLGVTLIQCKDGTTIENDSIAGKALLFAFGLAAEIEVKNLQQRTKMGLQVRKELKEKQGYWISKAGNVCTHFGREKGCNLDRAREAAAESVQAAKARWQQTSPAWQLVKSMRAAGVKIDDIYTELEKKDPEVYCTRRGGKISRAMLQYWCAELSKI